MKILRISHIFAYGAFQKLFQNIQLSNMGKSYQEELSEILKLKIDNCAALTRELNKIGFEVIDVYYDLEWLQKKWAKENSVSFQENNWLLDIVAEQISRNKPDIVFIQKSALGIHPFLEKLKDNYSFIKLVIVHSAYLGITGNLAYADILLAGTPSLVKQFRNQGLKPELFYHYFDEEILSEELYFQNHSYNLTFLGTSGFGQGYMHAERYAILKELIKESELELWINESERPKEKLGKAQFRLWLKRLARRFPLALLVKLNLCFASCSRLSVLLQEITIEKEYNQRGIFIPEEKLSFLFPQRCHPPLIGMDYYSIMANSKISFHKQGGGVFQKDKDNLGEIGALRLFEATGLGSCVVADTGPNMRDLFEEGVEIISYSSISDAVNKIKFLLGNESKRKEIALAGQRRTLKDHTARKRAASLSELIRKRLMR
jgi:spore maturation protein CgeB